MSLRQEIIRVGTVLSTTFTSNDTTPAFQVVMETSGGFLQLRWLGRTTVPGVTLGRRLQVRGIPVLSSDGPELINPDYQLLGAS